jgi:hypothetical protein
MFFFYIDYWISALIFVKKVIKIALIFHKYNVTGNIYFFYCCIIQHALYNPIGIFQIDLSMECTFFFKYTTSQLVKPVLRGHLWDKEKVAL